jgi:hypothetical protein
MYKYQKVNMESDDSVLSNDGDAENTVLFDAIAESSQDDIQLDIFEPPVPVRDEPDVAVQAAEVKQPDQIAAPQQAVPQDARPNFVKTALTDAKNKIKESLNSKHKDVMECLDFTAAFIGVSMLFTVAIISNAGIDNCESCVDSICVITNPRTQSHYLTDAQGIPCIVDVYHTEEKRTIRDVKFKPYDLTYDSWRFIMANFNRTAMDNLGVCEYYDKVPVNCYIYRKKLILDLVKNHKQDADIYYEVVGGLVATALVSIFLLSFVRFCIKNTKSETEDAIEKICRVD